MEDLRNRGWEQFGKPAKAVVISVVQKFYANTAERGFLLSFDYVIINEFIGIKVEDDIQYEVLMKI